MSDRRQVITGNVTGFQLQCAPAVAVEIVADGDAFASHVRVHNYKSHARIRYILVVDSDSSTVIQHHRVLEVWIEALYESAEDVIDFPELGMSMPVAAIYRGVDF